MATTIKLKNGSGAPLTGDLVQGEPALDLTNKRLYTEDSGGSVIEVGTNPTSLTTGTFTSTGIDDNATSTAITIDASQNVGIGTASPSTTFAVCQGTGTTGFEVVPDDANSRVIIQAYERTGAAYRELEYDGSSHQWNTSAATRMTLDSSGNLGIGTVSPSLPLEVNGVIESNAATNGVRVKRGSSGYYGEISVNYVSSKVETYIDSIAGPSFSGEHVFRSSIGGGAVTERMRIDSSGNLGIGTTNPGSKLDVVSASGSTYANIRRNSQSAGEVGLSLYGGTSGINWTIYQPTSSNDMRFYGNGADRLTIDSSGHVGIRTTPNAWRTTDSVLQLGNRASVTGLANDTHFSNNAYFDTGSTWKAQETAQATNYYQSAGIHAWRYAGITTAGAAISWSEAMRINTSGNLLVGKTSANSSLTGVQVLPEGDVGVTRDGSHALLLNRLTSDGDIALFRKDGTTVGSIVSRGGAHLSLVLTPGTGANGIGSTTNAIFSVDGTGNAVDNTNDLGTASVRWDDVYATNGTIQTSDANEKQDIEALSEAETRVAVAAKGLLRKFRWKSAVEEKGDDARVHFGIIAQDLQAAFEAEGLDAGRYAMFIHSTWTDEETGEERSRMGVRYSELLAFIIAAI
jgi:hypothetical protein